MAVDAVVAGIDQAAFEPFETGCVTGVQDLVPVFVPGEHFSEISVIIRKIFQAEAIVDGRVGQIGLTDEFGRRIIILLFLPMDSDLGFRGLDNIFSAHADLLCYDFNYLK
jgi:hypothetical protein